MSGGARDKGNHSNNDNNEIMIKKQKKETAKKMKMAEAGF